MNTRNTALILGKLNKCFLSFDRGWKANVPASSTTQRLDIYLSTSMFILSKY